MAKSLNSVLGEMQFDGLIADTFPETNVMSVNLKADAGEIKRGTVVVGKPGGEFAPLAAAPVADDALYVVADDVNTSENTAATVYRTGNFARSKLIVASGYTLTAADEEALRKSGIFVSLAI